MRVSIDIPLADLARSGMSQSNKHESFPSLLRSSFVQRGWKVGWQISHLSLFLTSAREISKIREREGKKRKSLTKKVRPAMKGGGTEMATETTAMCVCACVLALVLFRFLSEDGMWVRKRRKCACVRASGRSSFFSLRHFHSFSFLPWTAHIRELVLLARSIARLPARSRVRACS